jgi:predicted PurR-regulated permease PerM
MNNPSRSPASEREPSQAEPSENSVSAVVAVEQNAALPRDRVLLSLLVTASLALGWILLPFYGTILWSMIIALMFSPVHRWLKAKMGRHSSLAAISTLVIVVLMVILPVALISAALAREASGLFTQIQSGEINPTVYFRKVFEALPPWIADLLNRLGLFNFEMLLSRAVAVLTQGSQIIATHAFSLGQVTLEFLAMLFVTLYLSFFLIRDGDELARGIRRAIPLERAHKQELISKFTTVIRAIVKGNLLVAGIQGALGGLAFWVLGISGALLWAVMMAFLSLVPAVGAGLVWFPVAIYLFVTGALWQSIALTVYGVCVIGLVDNLLRPILVGKDTKMPDYVVMIATLGGLSVAGINGFILGPVIAAMFIAVLHIYQAQATE